MGTEVYDRSEFPNSKSHASDQLQYLINKKIKNTVNTSINGVISSFDATTQTCNVRIVQPKKQVSEEKSSVIYTDVEYPLLQNVPVLFPSGGGFTLTFPIKKGDECLLIFNQRSLDYWKQSNNGGVQENGSHMTYYMEDAIAIVGVNAPRTVGSSLPSINTDSPELRTNDGSAKLRITTTGIEVDGDLDVSGNITATGDITAGTVSLQQHTHPAGIPVSTTGTAAAQTGSTTTATMPPTP